MFGKATNVEHLTKRNFEVYNFFFKFLFLINKSFIFNLKKRKYK